MDDFVEIRRATKNLKCRCCNRGVDKGEPVMHTYTMSCRGHHVYLCISCIELVNNLYIDFLDGGSEDIKHEFK